MQEKAHYRVPERTFRLNKGRLWLLLCFPRLRDVQWRQARLFVAFVRVPGDGRARAFLDGGAGDAGFKLVRIAAGKLNLAPLNFADLAQDKGFSLKVLLF